MGVGLCALSRIFCFTQGSRIGSSVKGEEGDEGLGAGGQRGRSERGMVQGSREDNRWGRGQTQRGRWERLLSHLFLLSHSAALLPPVSPSCFTTFDPHILVSVPLLTRSLDPHVSLRPLAPLSSSCLWATSPICLLSPLLSLLCPWTLRSPSPLGCLDPPRHLLSPSEAPSATVFKPLCPRGPPALPTPSANLLTSSDSADLRVDHMNSMTATKTAMMRPQMSTTKMPPMFSMPRPGVRGEPGRAVWARGLRGISEGARQAQGLTFGSVVLLLGAPAPLPPLALQDLQPVVLLELQDG